MTAMVDNFAAKVDQYLLNWVVKYCLCATESMKSVHYQRVSGCPLLRECLSIEVIGSAVGLFRSVRYIVEVCY